MTIYIPRRPTRDIAAEYREKAKIGVKSISGRHRDDMTSVMARTILDHVGSTENCRVLDIGCGDASLLLMLPATAQGVGTLLTQEEADRALSLDLPHNISIEVASFDTLEAIPGTFDLIVVNGCLHFTFHKSAAMTALRRIVSKLNPEGRLWLGELPSRRPFRRRQVFDSKLKALAYVRNRYGFGFAVAFARHMLRRRHRANEIVECTPALWFVQPYELREIAADLGLRIIGSWNCVELTGDSFFADHNRFSALLSSYASKHVSSFLKINI